MFCNSRIIYCSENEARSPPILWCVYLVALITHRRYICQTTFPWKVWGHLWPRILAGGHDLVIFWVKSYLTVSTISGINFPIFSSGLLFLGGDFQPTFEVRVCHLVKCIETFSLLDIYYWFSSIIQLLIWVMWLKAGIRVGILIAFLILRSCWGIYQNSQLIIFVFAFHFNHWFSELFWGPFNCMNCLHFYHVAMIWGSKADTKRNHCPHPSHQNFKIAFEMQNSIKTVKATWNYYVTVSTKIT